MKNGTMRLAGLLLLAAGWCFCGELSRVSDLSFSAKKIPRGNNTHDSRIPNANWSYFLVNEYGRFLSSRTGRTDWGTAFRSDKMLSLPLSGPERFEKRQIVRKQNANAFEAYRYGFDRDTQWLYWNRNRETPSPDLRGAALIAFFTVPASGTYSIRGEVKWEQYAGAEMKQAAYEIGILHRDNSYTPLFYKEFPPVKDLRGIQVLANLSEEAKLQNISLKAGERLCFISAGSRANYRGIKVYDSSVKIVSDSLPGGSSGAEEALLRKLLPEGKDGKTVSGSGKNRISLERYKQILLKRMGEAPEIRRLYFWLHGPADADELLRGILTTRQYGKFTDTKTRIGLPGNVQWFRFPEDGYDLLVRDLSSMQWTNKLAEKYKATGDPRYLKAWIGYWTDFAEHWPRQYETIRRNREYLERLPNHSILWCDIPLYLGWRIQAFLQGLNAISRRPEAAAQMENGKFAEILLHIIEYEAGTAERQLTEKEWLPNQRQHCAIQLFLLGCAMPEFRDAARWRSLGLENVLNSGILPDGSDMEQSFNYNADLPEKISEMLAALRQLPPDQQETLRNPLENIYRGRYYFLHSLAKPNGALPIAGKNNTWRDYGKAQQSMPGLSSSAEFFKGSNEPRNTSGLLSDFSLLPLSKQIRDFVYEGRGTPPAFQSITFPFGGWSVLRSGWDRNALYAFLKSSRPGNGHWREGGNGLELHALGQALVVNSGGEMYHPDPKMKEYWNSTAAQNSISVDGYGQKSHWGTEIPRVWRTPVGDRFLTGREFDLIEGTYAGTYAGWNFYRDGANVTEFDRKPYREVIDDTRHRRTVILVKSAGIFIVRDTVNSVRPHRFTQSWLLAPEYTPEMLRIEDGRVMIRRPDSVNAAFYFYGIGDLKFSVHYGVYRDTQILGWVALLADREKWRFTPAVHLFAEWTSRGTKTLYTVIVPFRGENPVVKQTPLPDGFELQLKNGKKIRLADGKLSSGGYELSEQGETGFGRTIPIKIPKLFRWMPTEKGVVPAYE